MSEARWQIRRDMNFQWGNKGVIKKSFLAEVEFHSPPTLSDLAERIGVLVGVPMQRDDSDKYDEFPTFLGGWADLELILMGAPVEEMTREIQLIIKLDTELSFDSLWGSIPKFFHKIIVDKNPDERGYIDCSDELVEKLRSQGFLKCFSLK